jgi:hypothetical protein
LLGILLYSSFDLICIGGAFKLAPEWPRGLLPKNLDDDLQYHIKKLQCYSLSPTVDFLNTVDGIKKIINS